MDLAMEMPTHMVVGMIFYNLHEIGILLTVNMSPQCRSEQEENLVFTTNECNVV